MSSQQPMRGNPTMIESNRKLTGFKYAATLVGALAIVALAPATAYALPVNNNEGGGCHYTDKDGYDIPIDEGQDVFVDGKIVSCRGGSIVVTTAPASAGGSTKPTNLPPKVNVIGNLPRAAATR
nr:Unknown Function [uncultured bacterium]